MDGKIKTLRVRPALKIRAEGKSESRRGRCLSRYALPPFDAEPRCKVREWHPELNLRPDINALHLRLCASRYTEAGAYGRPRYRSEQGKFAVSEQVASVEPDQACLSICLRFPFAQNWSGAEAAHRKHRVGIACAISQRDPPFRCDGDRN